MTGALTLRILGTPKRTRSPIQGQTPPAPRFRTPLWAERGPDFRPDERIEGRGTA